MIEEMPLRFQIAFGLSELANNLTGFEYSTILILLGEKQNVKTIHLGKEPEELDLKEKGWIFYPCYWAIYLEGAEMNKDDQGQSGGFSQSEKGMLIRAACIGFIASLGTLWLGDVFDANGPSLLSLTVILACLFSLLVGVCCCFAGAVAASTAGFDQYVRHNPVLADLAR